MTAEPLPILVIGGGIGGMTAAIEAAEVGLPVCLVEKEAYLGGRTMRTHRYFPKMCPPTCGFEINVRRIRTNPRIAVHTLSTVTSLERAGRAFQARIRTRPRYVTGAHSLDRSAIEGLGSERPDDFNLGMGTTKAVYLPHGQAWPHQYVVDPEYLSEADAKAVVASLPEGAVDLAMEEEEFEIEAGAVVLATGWRPYDATKLDTLGFGRFQNVVTNVMMERLAAEDGPTGGRILRPGDGESAKNVAFVQCAGSRDENHLPYCSAVCCMATLKQIRYLLEENEEARATVFYIDIRTIGRLEKFYYDLLDDDRVTFTKGKVAEIEEDAASGNLILKVEDTIAGENLEGTFDLAVLATGVVPNTVDLGIAADVYGFHDGDPGVPGVFVAGCVRHPADVSRTTKEATAAALRAIQHVWGGE